jgi:hypothetical protein
MQPMQGSWALQAAQAFAAGHVSKLANPFTMCSLSAAAIFGLHRFCEELASSALTCDGERLLKPNLHIVDCTNSPSHLAGWVADLGATSD